MPDWDSDASVEKYMKDYRKWSNKKKKYRKLNLPYAGESFVDKSLSGYIARLRHLKEIGYNFPEHVFATLEEELQEKLTENTPCQ